MTARLATVALDPATGERLCLLTWNFKHMANLTIEKRIAALTRSLGFEMPAICTPLELIGE